MPRDDTDRKTVESSKEPPELGVAAQRLASSSDPADLQFIRAKLGDAGFLDRLDRKELYQGDRTSLRLSGVMKCLAQNVAPAARTELVALIQDPVFNAEFLRVDLLILALAKHSDPPKPVVDYWSSHFKADSAHANIVAMALCQNASPQAAAVLEQRLRDESFPENDRIGWLRAYFIENRNADGLLAMALRVIKGEGPVTRESIRLCLVEVVFDFRPSEWYTPHTTPTVPPRTLASKPARQLIRDCAAAARDKLKLTPQQELAITTTLKQLDAMDKPEDAPKK